MLGIGIVLQIPAVSDFIRFRASDAISSGGAGRINIWLVSWQMFLEHPILGVGWRVQEVIMDIRDLERVPFNVTWDDYVGFRPRIAHSVYLGVLVEIGLVGFILFMAWLTPLVLSPIYRDTALRNLWLVASAIFVAMLVGGLTNPELHKKYFWFSLAIVQGLRYYWLQNSHQHGQVQSGQVQSGQVSYLQGQLEQQRNPLPKPKPQG
jgi:hypothetical protein